MTTFEDRLIAAKGKPTGFDYLRIGLALLIVVWHEARVCYGAHYEDHLIVDLHWLRPFVGAILPMFFALSGFLVAGSLERCKSLVSFLSLRALRLVPALAVESVLAILVLGVAFTTLPKLEFLTNHRTISYLGNIVGSPLLSTRRVREQSERHG